MFSNYIGYYLWCFANQLLRWPKISRSLYRTKVPPPPPDVVLWFNKDCSSLMTSYANGYYYGPKTDKHWT